MAQNFYIKKKSLENNMHNVSVYNLGVVVS